MRSYELTTAAESDLRNIASYTFIEMGEKTSRAIRKTIGILFSVSWQEKLDCQNVLITAVPAS